MEQVVDSTKIESVQKNTTRKKKSGRCSTSLALIVSNIGERKAWNFKKPEILKMYNKKNSRLMRKKVIAVLIKVTWIFNNDFFILVSNNNENEREWDYVFNGTVPASPFKQNTNWNFRKASNCDSRDKGYLETNVRNWYRFVFIEDMWFGLREFFFLF